MKSSASGPLKVVDQRTLMLGDKKLPPLLFRSSLEDGWVESYLQRVEGDVIYFTAQLGSKDLPSGAVYPNANVIEAKVDAKTGTYLWLSVLNAKNDTFGEPIFTDTRLIFNLGDRIYALDKKTGDSAWAIYPCAGGIIEPFPIEKLTVKDGVVLAEGEKKSQRFEVDAETGMRVYRTTKYRAAKDYPLYIENMRPRSYSMLPPVPVDWECRVLREAKLVWNKKTGEGIILNPLKSDTKAIVKLANTISVEGKPVTWLYVFDGKTAHQGLPARTRNEVLGADAAKYPTAGQLRTQTFHTDDDAALNGEVVDAEPVANALGAKAITSNFAAPLPTKASPVIPFFDVIAYNPISPYCIEWGPYVFNEAHVNLIPGIYRL